ncbi:MAG TPA: hypothetical protein PLC07_03120 [Bacillota bacterium]|nr:hypothetical protein [Bacillota bacterium]HPT86714.1 hypothetical protein [Bacillota bacterium]
MKRIGVGMLAFSMMLLLSTVSWGAENDYKGSVKALVGNESMIEGSYQLSERIDLVGDYEDHVFRAGVDYDLSDKFGLQLGVRYDDEDGSTVAYGGFDFTIPFGTNLELSGFYNYNYEAKNEEDYEAYIKIEMYANQFLNAGVMRYTGSGTSNPDDEAKLFVRGDFSWQFNKYSIKLRPVLFIEGEFFHDYDFAYQANERLQWVLNINDLDDQELRYRIGVEYKF